MEDEDGDEDSSDFHALKRRKCSSGFTILGGLQRKTETRGKRPVSLLLKATQTKKKKGQSGHRVQVAEDLKKYIRFSKKDEVEFCPVCQAPFIGLVGKSAQVHVQECLEEKEKDTVMCPDGINCKFISPQHFKKFSHQLVANSRSTKDNKQHISTNQEEIKNQFKDNLLLSSEEKDSSKDSEISTCDKDENQSVCNLSSKTSHACLHQHENMKMITDTKDMDTILESEKTRPACGESDECIDEISQWFDDDLKYEDLELVGIGKYSGSTSSSTATISSSDACFLSQNVFPADVVSQLSTSSDTRKNKLCVDGLLTGNTRQTSSMKQMDIGEFFGLKPKLKAEKIGTGVSALSITKVSQSRMQSYNREGETGRKVPHKKCPFYKIVDGTSFAVDAFSYGNHIPGITAYFLSHFHYDHYCGLKKTFSNPIYCSQVTANLISLKIKVPARFIHPLPLHKTVKIQNVEITLLDANHCPGAVMFIFKLPNGKTHLHTGDFRASTIMEEDPILCSSNIHTLYLDTTYCDPDYSFPPQSDTVNYCASLALKAVARNPKTLIVVGTYTIGKEKIFIALADALQCKVGVRRDKLNILQCLGSKHQNEIITQNYKDAQVHVLPMTDLSHKKLALYLKEYSFLYCELLAIKPTGWTFTSCGSNLASIKPSKQGPVTIYGVPYSEHSSYKELQRFVKFIKPCKIIPTVNNGSAAKRDEMNKVFKMWLME